MAEYVYVVFGEVYDIRNKRHILTSVFLNLEEAIDYASLWDEGVMHIRKVRIGERATV